MGAMTFIAGVAMTLAFHELDLIRSRSDNGKFRKRSARVGWVLMSVSIGLIALAGWTSR